MKDAARVTSARPGCCRTARSTVSTVLHRLVNWLPPPLTAAIPPGTIRVCISAGTRARNPLAPKLCAVVCPLPPGLGFRECDESVIRGAGSHASRQTSL